MPTLTDGDRRFEGVEERRDPGSLPAGVLSEGINLDLTDGEVDTRRGFYATPGYRGRAAAFPCSFDVAFDTPVGHGTTYGAGPYTSEFGESYVIMALANYALRVHDSGTVVMIEYPFDDDTKEGLTVDDDVRFVQAFTEVFMFRGRDKTAWVWDGKEIDNPQFLEVATTNSGAVVDPMPQSDYALYYLNRLWVKSGNDEIWPSDVGVSTDYTVARQFKIDSGAFDSVVGYWPWGDNSIVVFKEKSFDVLENLGDISNATRTRISNEIGLSSPNCMTDVGSDLWFLSERGVFSVRMGFENKLKANADPLSKDLEHVFKRINWTVKSKFISTFWDNSYYLAVALDDSTTNNAVIKYSFITNTWHGYHTSSFLEAKYMFVSFTNNEKYQYFVTEAGVIFRMYVGLDDEGLSTTAEIAMTAKTRGFGAAELDRKQFRRMFCDISEWNASYSLTVATDGVNETQVTLPNPLTRKRTKYHTSTTTDYVIDNTNDDHGNAFREDYSIAYAGRSVSFPAAFPVAFKQTKTAQETYEFTYGDNGADPNHMQRVEVARPTDMRGEYLTIELNSTKGRVKWHSAKTDGFTHNRTMTIAV